MDEVRSLGAHDPNKIRDNKNRIMHEKINSRALKALEYLAFLIFFLV